MFNFNFNYTLFGNSNKINNGVNNNTSVKYSLKNKSIIGDSISTFNAISNDTNSNTTIGNNLARHPQGLLCTLIKYGGNKF